MPQQRSRNEKQRTLFEGQNSYDIDAIVIEELTEKTGYDQADLLPHYELEADLGIDTVKQAELFADLRERLNLDEEMDIQLSEVPTIESLIQWFKARVHSTENTNRTINPISSAEHIVPTKDRGLANKETIVQNTEPPVDTVEQGELQLPETSFRRIETAPHKPAINSTSEPKAVATPHNELNSTFQSLSTSQQMNKVFPPSQGLENGCFGNKNRRRYRSRMQRTLERAAKQ